MYIADVEARPENVEKYGSSFISRFALIKIFFSAITFGTVFNQANKSGFCSRNGFVEANKVDSKILCLTKTFLNVTKIKLLKRTCARMRGKPTAG